MMRLLSAFAYISGSRPEASRFEQLVIRSNQTPAK
jgi:hypothetical protein